MEAPGKEVSDHTSITSRCNKFKLSCLFWTYTNRHTNRLPRLHSKENSHHKSTNLPSLKSHSNKDISTFALMTSACWARLLRRRISFAGGAMPPPRRTRVCFATRGPKPISTTRRLYTVERGFRVSSCSFHFPAGLALVAGYNVRSAAPDRSACSGNSRCRAGGGSAGARRRGRHRQIRLEDR